jgi:SNF2 family DNA or RNA helicase
MMELLSVQQAALTAGSQKTGYAYYMEMGLGKTLVAYHDFLDKVVKGQAHRMVVVCPNSFKGGWVDEAIKHNLEVTTHVFHSGNDYDNARFARGPFNRPPVLIVNYEAIRSERVQDYIFKFIQNRPCFIVFDESIQLKNNKSEQTQSALILAKHFNFRRVLSGKPITQGPHDLWGQMRAIGLLDGKNYYSFKTAFCRMGGYMNKKVIGAQNEDILSELVNHAIFRATKTEWTDLPPKLYTQREYEMTPLMRQQYRQMEQEFVLWLENGEDVSVEAAITKYIKLAQIACGFIIKEDGTVSELISPTANPRIKLIKEIIEREITGKVIITYNHRYCFKILSESFVDYDPAWIQGGMTTDALRHQQELFNNDPKCRILLAQIRASKYGFTLLGGPEPENRCATPIFFENTFSLDDRSQVEDRNHRHGQTSEKVLYVDLFGTPLDYRVNSALQLKEGIFQTVFSKLRRANNSLLRASS